MATVPTTPNRSDGDQTAVIPTNPYVGIRVGNLTGVDSGLARLITGAKVDLEIGKVSYAELFFRNLNRAVTDDLSWAEGQRVQVFMGYANIASRQKLLGAFSMSIPKFEFGGQQLITMRGLGDGVEMTRVARRRVFENMTYDAIVKKIALEYGYDTNTISPNLRDTIPSATQAGVSDYEFVKELSVRAGTDFFVFGSNLFFMVPALEPEEDWVTFDVNSDGVRNVVFSVVGEGELTAIASSPINPRTGEFEVVGSEFFTDGIFDVEQKDQVRFTDLAYPRIVYVDGQGNLLSKSALQARVDSEANRRKNIVKVRAVVTGYERLMPRQVVLFLSAGLRFRGPYYVTRVVHEMRAQGSDYVTIFEGTRATTGAYGRVSYTSTETVGGTPMPLEDVSNRSQKVT